MSGTSPTLHLLVDAPQALGTLKELQAAVATLKAGLAGLNSQTATGTKAGFTRIEAEVKELRAALTAARMENELLAKSVQTKAAAATAAAAKEVAAVKTVAAAKKAAVAEEEAAQEKAAAWKRRLQVKTGEMTVAADLKANAAVEASLVKHLAVQDKMREAAALKEAARIEALAAHNHRVQLRSAEMTGALAIKAHDAVEASLAAHLAKQEAMKDRAAREDIRRQQLVNNAHAAALAEDVRRQRAADLTRAASANAAAAASMRAGEGTGRSAARGLAGATGGLWLTYGQNIPALVGAYGAGMAVKSSVQKGSEFQYQTQFAGALGGLKPEQLAKVRAELLALGTDAVMGPVELAKGMRVLQQAGIGAVDSLKVLPTAIRVALQGETDMTAASETLVGVMNQFNLGLSDIPRIGDAISKTASVTVANVGDLMESLKQATGINQRYGTSLETVLSMVGLLAKQGITGQSAGTFSRRFIEELYQPHSDDARRAFKEIGFSAYNANGSTRNSDEVIQDFVQRMSGYDEKSRNAMLTQIFDLRAAKQAAALVADLNNHFKQLRKDIDDSAGALERFEASLSSSTKLLWAQTKNNVEAALIVTFSEVEEPLNRMLTAMKELFKAPETLQFLKLLMLIPKGYMDIAALGASEAMAPTGQGPGPSLQGLPGMHLRGARALVGGTQSLFEKLGIVDPVAPAGGLPGRTRSGRIIPLPAITDITAFEAGLNQYSPQLGKKTASQRVIDPLAAREALQLSQAQDQATVAAASRATRKIEQEANFATRLADEKHRNLLISENDYNAEIERIQDKRLADEIAMTEEALTALQAQEDKKWTQAQKVQNQTRQADLRFKLDEQRREAQQVKDLRKIRAEGNVKAIKDETSKILEVARRDEELRVEQRDLTSKLRLAPPELAARYKAEFDARKRFDPELVNIEEALKKQAGNGAAVEALNARKAALIELREAYVAVQGAEAEMIAAHERTFGYGAQDAFRAYVDAANNAADNARTLWGTTFQGLEDSLTQFVMTGKISFRSLANTILEELIRIQMRKAIAGVVNAFINPAGAIGGADVASAGSADVLGVSSVGVAHTGGILGLDTLRARSAPTALWSDAQRFHGGGVIGPTEVPIIAERGEGVFTPAQMRSLAPVGGSQAPSRIEIINNGTPQKVTGTEQHFDGEGMILRIITTDIARNGPVAQALESNFGMTRRGR